MSCLRLVRRSPPTAHVNGYSLDYSLYCVQLPYQASEGSFCCCWDNTVTEESELICSIVTGDAQLGIVQPTGKFIKVSTQRGFNLPLVWLFTCWSSLSVMLPSFCLCAPVYPVAVCHDSRRLPSVLLLAGTARPCFSCRFTASGRRSPRIFPSLRCSVV